jgi:hypothetical protein
MKYIFKLATIICLLISIASPTLSKQCNLELANACTDLEMLCLLAKAESTGIDKLNRIEGYIDYVKLNNKICPNLKQSIKKSLSKMPKCIGNNPKKWTKCVGETKLKSGTIFYGTFKDGEPNGIGRATLKGDNPKMNYYGGISNLKFTGSGLQEPAYPSQISKDQYTLIYLSGFFGKNGLEGPTLIINQFPPTSNVAGYKTLSVGHYTKGQFNGLGYKTFPNATYFGFLENGKANGSGSLHYVGGEKQSGIFRDGYLSAGNKTIHVLPNGYVKTGSYKNGKFHGPGKLVSPEGTEWKVTWHRGKLSDEDQMKIYFYNLPEDYRTYIQNILKKQGLYSSNVDGYWGPGTSRAIRIFAKKSNLSLQSPNKIFDYIFRINSQNISKNNRKKAKKRNQRQKRDAFILGLFATMAILGGTDSPSFASNNFGFLTNHYISGMNRICIYSDGFSQSTTTVSASSMCSISPTGIRTRSMNQLRGFLKREYVSGLNKICVYSDGISTSTRNQELTDMCPLSN